MKEVIGKLQENIEKSNGSVEEMQCIFYETAKELMNNYVLKIEDDIEVELKEVEFYYYDKNKHPDDYTHGHNLQKECCKLYVHGSGLDITFGNGKYYGGILIRGIKINGKYVAGPGKVMQKIAKELGIIKKDNEKFNYEELQQKLDNLYESNKIYLNDNKQEIFQNKYLYIYSREGLLRKFKKYSHALYRFFAYDYFNEKNNIINRDSIKPKEEIRALTFIIYNKKIDSDYSIENVRKNIEKYCKEQNCKYHICYFMELLKQKLQEKECIKNKGTK